MCVADMTHPILQEPAVMVARDCQDFFVPESRSGTAQASRSIGDITCASHGVHRLTLQPGEYAPEAFVLRVHITDDGETLKLRCD